MYSHQKILHLKEDIRAYSDEGMSQELLFIKARKILDFSAAYDVTDSLTGEYVGALRRKGFQSLVRDEWHVLNVSGQQIGLMIEDDLTQALLRRFLLGWLLPQNYDILVGQQRAADLRQQFNPFRYVLEIDFRMDPGNQLDRRLGIAAALLLGTVEGKQD